MYNRSARRPYDAARLVLFQEAEPEITPVAVVFVRTKTSRWNTIAVLLVLVKARPPEKEKEVQRGAPLVSRTWIEKLVRLNTRLRPVRLVMLCSTAQSSIRFALPTSSRNRPPEEFVEVQTALNDSGNRLVFV